LNAPFAWAYQAPYCPSTHADQCYYRATSEFTHMLLRTEHNRTGIDLLRFADSSTVQLRFEASAFSASARFNAGELRVLRDAINDALTDIAALTPQMPTEEVFA